MNNKRMVPSAPFFFASGVPALTRISVVFKA